jgi:hypothetical protein
VAVKSGCVTWEPGVSKTSAFASLVSSAVEHSASWYRLLCGCLSLMQVDGWTALHMAAMNGHTNKGHPDIVKALLAAGATVSATTTVRGLVSRVRVGSHGMCRAGGLAVKPDRVTWGRYVFERSIFASLVSSVVKYSASWHHSVRCGVCH